MARANPLGVRLPYSPATLRMLYNMSLIGRGHSCSPSVGRPSGPFLANAVTRFRAKWFAQMLVYVSRDYWAGPGGRGVSRLLHRDSHHAQNDQDDEYNDDHQPYILAHYH
jgi:hypothetical protein